MSLKKNIIANFIGQGWTALMGLAFVPLYIKHLGIEAYGLIGFYAVLQAWFTLLDMGITQTLNREMARFTAGAHTPKSIRDLLRSLETIAIFIVFVIGFSLSFLSRYIAEHWFNPQFLNTATVANAIAIMGVIIAFRFMEGIYKGALLGLQQQVKVNLIIIIFSTMRFAIVVPVLIFFSSTIEVFFLWQAICSLLSLIAFALAVYKYLPLYHTSAKFSKRAIMEVKSFAKGMIGITFLALLLTQIDKLLLSKLITLSEYGFYVLASTIAGGLALVAAPTSQALYPKLVEYVTQNKDDLLIKNYHLGSQIIVILVVPISVMLMFFGKDIIFIWSNDQNIADQTTPILLPLLIGSALNCLVWMPYQLQLAYGWTSFAIKINTIAVLVLVPAIYFTTKSFGAIGAAWCWAVLNIAYITVGMHFMYQKLLPTEKWNWYWNDLLKQLFVCSFFVWISKELVGNPVNNNNYKLALIIGVYFVTINLAVFFSNKIMPLLIANLRSQTKT